MAQSAHFELQTGNFCGSEMTVMLNVCGGISAGTKVYILSYKLVLFCGSEMTVMLNICGGISAGTKVNILSYKLAFFVDLE